ncbi:uncharacterized protein LOC131165422 [Malania oleifera]|uniref:uncharacterized protein LOC131165422 n=1 Tax=Malania oleifera TaxID=397392 RepID=UPI0025AE37CA|nr:uncharacterized protein LOC131165422 [Malania oleifera]
MHGFSTVDGFVEITESLAEMIKYVANEPSVGLFYVQQHAQNQVPNLINLRNNVIEQSRETTLHTEDLEDSITMVTSMNKCGLPIADEMIKDIRNSLGIMSTKQPKRGLIQNTSSGLLIGRTSSWGPTTWGRNSAHGQQDVERTGNYFSSVFKSAKQKASNFRWPQFDTKEPRETKGEKSMLYPNAPLSVVAAGTDPALPHIETDELPLSSQIADALPEVPVGRNLSSHNLLSETENYEDFRADKEAKLKEWLDETGKRASDDVKG